MRFYKRDPDAALAGMAELSLQERGAYNTIIDALYSRDGHLPDDDDLLRRIMGCHKSEWKAVKSRLIAARKIWIEDGFLKANRVEETLSEAEEFSEKQRKRASKRWQTIYKRPTNDRQTTDKHATKSEITQQNQQSDDAIGGNANTSTPTDIYSEAYASGADAPKAANISRLIFGSGLAFMVENGVDEKLARSLIGKWRGEHTDGVLLAAIGKAQREGAIDVVGFIEGCFRAVKKSEGLANDRLARKMEMARSLIGRAESEAGMADAASGNVPLVVLPARRTGGG